MGRYSLFLLRFSEGTDGGASARSNFRSAVYDGRGAGDTFGDATTKLFAAVNRALTRFTGIMFADAAHAIIRYMVMSGRARSASQRQSGEQRARNRL